MSKEKENKTWSLNETAKAQIDLKDDIEKAHDQLDQQWKSDREKLASMPVSEPSLGNSYSPARSIQHEYVRLRSQHNHLQKGINTHSEQQRSTIRRNGTTLSDELNKAAQENRPSLKGNFNDLNTANSIDLPEAANLADQSHNQSNGRSL